MLCNSNTIFVKIVYIDFRKRFYHRYLVSKYVHKLVEHVEPVEKYLFQVKNKNMS